MGERSEESMHVVSNYRVAGKVQCDLQRKIYKICERSRNFYLLRTTLVNDRRTIGTVSRSSSRWKI